MDAALEIETQPQGHFLLRNAGILSLHLACLLVFFVPFTPLALLLALGSHFLRAFGLTAGFHRYFAHGAFKAGRGTQFALAFLGTTAAQMGPLWWAGHHVLHHRFVDSPRDIHSPVARNFWWAHLGWFCSGRYLKTNPALARRFQAYPELDFLNRHHHLPFLLFSVAMAGLGALVGWLWPQSQAGALQFLVWGAVIPTVTLFHATFCVNSVCHLWGYRCYETNDYSRNNPLVALATLGEGWHNNHHHFPGAARQGVMPWEADPTWLGLLLLQKLGLVWDLRQRPERLRRQARPTWTRPRPPQSKGE